MKKLSVLFTDIVGSTSLYHKFGDTYARSIIRQHDELIVEAVARNGGHIVKRIGDAFLVYFVSQPDSIRCAMDIQKALDEKRQSDRKFNIHIRIGIHCGPVVLEDNDIFGDTINISSRVESLAGADHIVFTQDVYDGLNDDLRKYCRVINVQKLKGVDKRYKLYNITWSGCYREYLDAYPSFMIIRLSYKAFNDVDADAITMGERFFNEIFSKGRNILSSERFGSIAINEIDGFSPKIILYPLSLTTQTTKVQFGKVFEDIFDYASAERYTKMYCVPTGVLNMTRKMISSNIISLYLEYIHSESLQVTPHLTEINIGIRPNDRGSYYEEQQYVSGVREAIDRWMKDYKLEEIYSVRFNNDTMNKHFLIEKAIDR